MKYRSIGAACLAVALAVADTGVADAVGVVVSTEADEAFTEAVPTSPAVAIGADTAGTAEPTVAMAATVDTATMDQVL